MMVLDSRPEQKDWLFWDGNCGFCRECAAWVRRRDRGGRFEVVPYQQAPSPPMTDELRGRCRLAVQVLTRSGELISAGGAVGYVLSELGYASIGRVLTWKWLSPAVEWGYRRVANNRNLIGRLVFGRECSDDGSAG